MGLPPFQLHTGRADRRSEEAVRVITRLTIKNFKGLADFQLPEWTSAECKQSDGALRLGPLVILVGPNGAGKSTILQVLGFLSHLVVGGLKRWVEERHWSIADLHSRTVVSPYMDFSVEVSLDSAPYRWAGRLDYSSLRCSHETIKSARNEDLLFQSGGQCQVEGKQYDFSAIEFEGSVLSVLRMESLSERLRAVKTLLSEIGLLEQLSSERLRRPSGKVQSLETGGEGLAGFLAHLTRPELESIRNDLRIFFPEVQRLSLRTLSEGSSELLFEEQALFEEKTGFLSSALHSSDGRLRVLALISQTYSQRRLILVDEVENGIYPESAEKLIDYIRARAQQTGKQFWLTTHNPLILNYLPDPVAIESIFLVQRGGLGQTLAEPYFANSSTLDKLRYMGPGEAFLDTRLEDR